MADATDLKSVGLLKARAGSSPAIGTSEKTIFIGIFVRLFEFKWLRMVAHNNARKYAVFVKY